MRTSIAALVAASAMLALLAGGAPAQAQVWFEYRTWSTPRYGYDEPPPRVLAPAPLPRSAVRSIVGRSGFDVVGPIARRGEVYIVPVEDMRGRRVRLVVDAFDGEILDRLAAVGPPRPPAEVGRGRGPRDFVDRDFDRDFEPEFGPDFGPGFGRDARELPRLPLSPRGFSETPEESGRAAPSARGRLARPGLPANPPSPPPRPSDLAALPPQPGASQQEAVAPPAAEPERKMQEEAARPSEPAPTPPEPPREEPAPAIAPEATATRPASEDEVQSQAPVAQAPTPAEPAEPAAPQSQTRDTGEGGDGTSEPQRRQPRIVYPGLHNPQQGD